MSELKNKLWVEKHRPKTIKDYIFHNSKYKAQIKEMIENQSIPHILLSGVQGSGKTTLAFILIHELNVDPSDVLVINA